MLEIICGRAGSGKTAYCLDKIKEELIARPMGPAIILLLPEHMTYRVERELAVLMEQYGAGFVRCHVYGFRRFAHQILMETGGGLEPGLTELGRQLLIKKILDSKRSELHVFSKAARQRGFVKTLGKILDELKSYGVSAEQLIEVQAKIKEQRLKGKLHDLAILSEEFTKEMAGRFQDKGDMLNRLIEKLPISNIVKGAEVWLDGFLFFNPQERLILQGLINHAQNVHITLNLDPVQLDNNWENVKVTGIFFRSYFTLQNLRKMAQAMQLDMQLTVLEKIHRYQKAPLGKIEKELYTFHRKGEGFGEITAAEQQDGVQIIEAANARLEMEAVAADILRLVREKGYKWREIGILVRDLETYSASLPMVLQDYHIPYFSDQKRPCANHQLAELIRSSLNMVRTGWQYDSVFRCLKTGFFQPNSEQLDLLENYVLEFGIRGSKRWLQENDWDFFRRRRMEDNTIYDDEIARLAQVNAIRRDLITPLSHLQEGIKNAENTKALTMALYDFLLELNVPEILAQWAKDAENEGRLAEAKEHHKVWQDVIALLDQLVELSGEESMALAEYEAIVGEGLDALQVTMIPPGIDYVNIASFDQNSLDNHRAIYILGVVAGSMPRRTTENAILSDADRLNLEDAVKHDKAMEALSIVGRDNSFNEKYLIYKAFTQAREYLCLSYPLSDSDGNGKEPATLIKRVRHLLPQMKFLSIPLESLEWKSDLQNLMLAEKRTAISGLAAALRNSRDKQIPVNTLWKNVYNWSLEKEKLQPALKMVRDGLFFRGNSEQLTTEMAQRLFTKKKILKASVSKLENFCSCHFKFFAEYGLKLQERPEYKFAVADFGNLLHGVLNDFGCKMKAEGRAWGSVKEDECREICRELLYKRVEDLPNNILRSSKQREAQLMRIYHTACHVLLRLCDWDKVSSFHPSNFEEKFDSSYKKDSDLYLKLIEDCQLAITGSIDRIDKMAANGELDEHFLVIDYKSSKHTLDLLELYYGLNMQLITYILVAMNIMKADAKQDVLPAAMLYCLLDTTIIDGKRQYKDYKEDQIKKEVYKNLRLNGWFMAATEVIKAIDPETNYINLSVKNNGEFYSESLKKIISEKKFENLKKFMKIMLVQTGNAIVSGDITVEPIKLNKNDSCKYCKYKAFCGYNPELPGFNKKKLEKYSKDEVMEIIEEEINKNDM